jgi:hypothetical protein
MDSKLIRLVNAIQDMDWGLDNSLSAPEKENFWVQYPNKRCTMKHNNKKSRMSKKDRIEKRKQKKSARKKNRT